MHANVQHAYVRRHAGARLILAATRLLSDRYVLRSTTPCPCVSRRATAASPSVSTGSRVASLVGAPHRTGHRHGAPGGGDTSRNSAFHPLTEVGSPVKSAGTLSLERKENQPFPLGSGVR